VRVGNLEAASACQPGGFVRFRVNHYVGTDSQGFGKVRAQALGISVSAHLIPALITHRYFAALKHLTIMGREHLAPHPMHLPTLFNQFLFEGDDE
jgi:hypothetical protein